ncbi:MAG: hypothetical protein KJZ80_00375 [Hyphomicrobiaceae bacterium]|nr:hypothetical protein [Hyphomicrobiaceae bacterium]
MPLRSFFAFVTSLPVLLLAPAIAAEAGKYEFRVTGVSRADSLNIRERVEDQASISDAKILGQIPANEGGVLGSGASLKVGRVRWFEVRYKETRGWVNGRYLAPVSPELGSELDSNLFCAGTEPFWSLKVADGLAEVTQPDAPPERYAVAIREPFQGRDDALALRLVSEEGPEISALVQHREWCSDGMSDLDYAFEVSIVGLDGERRLRGCCSLLR